MARTGLSQKPHVCRQRWPTVLSRNANPEPHGPPNPAKCEPLVRSEGPAHHRALGCHVTGHRVMSSVTPDSAVPGEEDAEHLSSGHPDNPLAKRRPPPAPASPASAGAAVPLVKPKIKDSFYSSFH